MKVVVTTHGVDRCVMDFEDVAMRADMPFPALEEVIGTMREIEKVVFSSQGRRGGGSWAQLQPATVARKARLGLDPRILRATQRLYDAMTDRNSDDQDFTMTPTGFVWMITVPYAGVQQSGGGKSNLPARPYLRFSSNDRREFARIIAKYTVGPVKGKRSA